MPTNNRDDRAKEGQESETRNATDQTDDRRCTCAWSSGWNCWIRLIHASLLLVDLVWNGVVYDLLPWNQGQSKQQCANKEKLESTILLLK